MNTPAIMMAKNVKKYIHAGVFVFDSSVLILVEIESDLEFDLSLIVDFFSLVELILLSVFKSPTFLLSVVLFITVV